MLLDDLVNVIKTLQKRIDAHRQSLQQNETRTRTALIDPLLSAVGWDVADPSLVTPEYNVGQGRADYALKGSQTVPDAIVEVKRLGHALNDREHMQMLTYANMEGIKYALLTDGNVWELYDIFKRAQLPERRLLSVKIAGTPAHKLALELLLLWRPNLASGSPVTAREPVLGIRQEPATTEALHQPLDNSLSKESASSALSTVKQRISSSSTSEKGTPERSADPELSENGGRRCLYRVNGEDWTQVKDATDLLLAILGWCAQEHELGKDEYYQVLSTTSFSTRKKSSNYC